MAKASTYGIRTDNPDNTPALVQAINDGVRHFEFEAGAYSFGSTVELPQECRISLQGAGYAITEFHIGGAVGRPLIRGQRLPGKQPMLLEVKDVIFAWAGARKATGSSAIVLKGAGNGEPEPWVRTEGCMSYNFADTYDLEHAGNCYFEKNWGAFGGRMFRLRRGASFVHLIKCFSHDDMLVYAFDPQDDAFSNGLILDNCESITANGCNVFVRGWQAVAIVNQCGFDLGWSDQQALRFVACQDVRIREAFVSSQPGIIREGIVLDGCHTFNVADGTLVNCSVGIRVIPPTQFSPANGVVSGMTFDGQLYNDILLMQNTRGFKAIGNHHKKRMARTGTDFEVFGATAGSGKNIYAFNSFAGEAYDLAAGQNGSIATGNLFDVAA